MQKKTGKFAAWIVLGFLGLLLMTGGAAVVRAEAKAEERYQYLLPESDTRYYTEEEIENMPLQAVCYAKNEIYARHNRIFKSEELQAYFSSQWWYEGNIDSEDFLEAVLNEYEKANAKLLYERENSLQDGGYVLDAPNYDTAEVEEYLRSLYPFNIGRGFNVTPGVQTSQLMNEYFILDMPGTQSAAWGYEESTALCLEIYCQAARDAGYNGAVMSLMAYDLDDESYLELPNYKIAGESEEKRYVALFPTDLQYDPVDSSQAEDYQELLEWVERCDVDSEDCIFSLVSISE